MMPLTTEKSLPEKMVTMTDIVAVSTNFQTLLAIIMFLEVKILIYSGKRFLDFPEKKFCCYCCNSTHGCGIVTTDWLKTANASYVGTEKLDEAEPYMKWEIKGLQTNYYYHKNDTQNTPRRLFQSPDDLQDFQNYRVGLSDESVFKLPSYCTDVCGFTTICAALRQELITS